MPVDVHIPVGVRMKPNPSPDDLFNLETRTGELVRRALEVTREQVLVPRGRGRPVVVVKEGVHFTRPLSRDDTRAAIEEAVSRALTHAVAASGVETWHTPGDVSALSGERAGEPIDRSRLYGNVYRVPAYNGGGAATSIVTEGEITFTEPLTVERVLEEAWHAHTQRFGRTWDPATYGYPGYYGAFAIEGTWVEDQLVYFAHVEAVDDRGNPTAFRWQGGSFDMFQVPPGDGTETPLRRGSLTPPIDHYVLTRTEHLGTQQALSQLMEDAAANDPDYPYDAATRERLAVAAAQPSWNVYRVDGGAHIGYVVLPPGSDTSGIGHSPIRFVAPGQLTLGMEAGGGQGSGGQGEGGGTEAGGGGAGGGAGGTGTRQRGGPLGTAEGAGRVWPTLGPGGEKLICEPFLGEPPVHTLPVGAEALDQKMRSLASQLELDYCGYAGRFCLNLAKLIGGRSHAIGVTSANSSVQTQVTVRTDGAGNNGFVHVQPGHATELQYLENLGDIAVQVDRLAGEIMEVYRSPANRHLIYWDEDHDLDPNPAAWNLRFTRAVFEALEQSCMWLYAECCRVILFQQLRSSHQAITQRRAQFDETLQRFEEALGILGESVIRLTVLKRALSWGRRYGRTGTARSVLSHTPPPRRMGHEYYDVPAPIESIATTIITQLEGATIAEDSGSYVAHFEGRRWTTEDLDAGIAMRRGMLNRVDPLFLQVPDLESVYNRFRSNPASARTYLDGVLSEMLRANVEMTSETRDREDGAFFALEASQYVKANGGYNERGLKFDLQGIHALADDVLRPYSDGTDAYRRGINRAIGVKAGWDDFISVFSTAGIIVLGLLCAPLGLGVALLVTSVAGLALTAYDISEADRMEDLYHSLIDPEAILSWQDVQMQRFMANLSIAFSIFDVIGVLKVSGAIVRAFRDGLRQVARQGIRGAARGALLAGRRQLLANMAQEVLENAMKQALMEAVIVSVMGQLLPRIMQPILVPWMRSVAVAHGTLREVDAALGPLAAGQPAPSPITAVINQEIVEGPGGTLPAVIEVAAPVESSAVEEGASR